GASSCCIARCFISRATATTVIYTLSLHDALPIYVDDNQCGDWGRDRAWDHRVCVRGCQDSGRHRDLWGAGVLDATPPTSVSATRSEEHTSELQSRENLVCRLLLEKKKNTKTAAPR